MNHDEVQTSSHVGQSGSRNSGNFCWWNPESYIFVIYTKSLVAFATSGGKDLPFFSTWLTHNLGPKSDMEWRSMYGILESEKFMLVESEIWERFVCGKWNLGLWNPEYNTRNPASPLTIGMQNPSSTHKDWNPYLESGIHGKESRIQDYFGFRYLGRQPDAQFWKWELGFPLRIHELQHEFLVTVTLQSVIQYTVRLRYNADQQWNQRLFLLSRK